MKKTVKHLLVLLALCMIGFVLFSLSSFAVPAAPGSAFAGADALCRSHAGKTLVTLDSIPADSRNASRKIPKPGKTTKNIPLLTLVIGFKDVPYQDGYNWADEIFKGDESLRTYYSDMSFGQFTFEPVVESCAYGKDGNTNKYDKVNDGVIHVSLSRKHDNWTGIGLTGLGVAARDLSMAQSIAEAILKASAFIDFKQYDANNDGKIATNEMALALVFAGYEAAAIDPETFDSNLEKYLWAHAWTLEEMIEEYGWKSRTFSIPTPAGVAVSSYIAIAEQMSKDEQEPISVLAHELGHYLGLPDLYNTQVKPGGDWVDYDVSYASVMSGGSWGEKPDGGIIPYSMDVWSRYVLGWVEPVAANKSGTYNVVSQSYSGNQDFTAVRIDTQNDNEYYLLENRQHQKWDAGIAKNYEGASLTSGIILWHVDMGVFDKYFDDNGVNNGDHRPAVMPLYPESDNDNTVTFLGKSKNIYVFNPFYDSVIWNNKYKSAGSMLDLPMYGRDGKGDDRAARQTTGIKVQFVNKTAHDMQIKLDMSAKKHFHKWELTATAKRATCTEAGSGTYTCSECKQTKTDSIPALDHDIGGNGVCSRCGKAFCPYCHKEHTGFFGNIVAFFHRIIYRLTHLFSR